MIRYLTLLLFIVLQSCVGYSQSIVGSWLGNLDFGVQKLKFVLHIQEENGTYTAKADSPDQGAYGIPFDIVVKGDSVVVKNSMGIALGLKMQGDHKLVGTFSQNGITIPVVLSRSEQKMMEALKVNRYQTPHPPYAYDTLDVTINNSYSQIKLAGTVTKPKGKGKYPAVVLLSGSGAQDRDETLFGHKPFKVLADYLSRNGIVVLRYDDRGVGKSEGSFDQSTIEDFSKDAISAFDFLKQQDYVDIHKVGIIGHSEGGLIATLLAAQGVPNLSFIVSLAGPSIPIDELLVEQLYSLGKAEGMSEAQLAQAREINRKNFAVVKSNLKTEEAYQKLLENMNIADKVDANAALRKEVLAMLAPAYRYFVRINPQHFIKDIHIPVFGAFGTLDLQVPSTLNLKGYYDLLPKNTKTVLKEYEGLNHLFQRAKTGKVSEYAQLEETFHEKVMEDIVRWIKEL